MASRPSEAAEQGDKAIPPTAGRARRIFSRSSACKPFSATVAASVANIRRRSGETTWLPHFTAIAPRCTGKSGFSRRLCRTQAREGILRFQIDWPSDEATAF